MGQNHPLTNRIAFAVAEREGVATKALPPIQQAIPIEAVEDLFARDDPALVTFRYLDYEVVVRRQDDQELSIYLRPQNE